VLLAVVVCAVGAALTRRLGARSRWCVLALLLGGTLIGLRLSRIQTMWQEWHTPTEVERVARSLAEGRGFHDPFGFPTGPTAHVSPLYPFYVAGIYTLISNPDSAQERLALVASGMAATLITFLLLPTLAVRLGMPAAAGWLAAFLLAGTPRTAWIEAAGTHEQPFARLVLVVLVLMACRLHHEAWTKRRTVLMAGVLLGVIGLLAPNLLAAAGLLLLFDWIALNGCRRRVVLGALMQASVALLLLLPWMTRNYIVLGKPLLFRSNFGLELAIGNAPDSTGCPSGPAFNRLHPLGKATAARVRAMGEVAFMRCQRDSALTWIQDDPGRFVHLSAKRAAWFLLVPREGRPSEARITSWDWAYLLLACLSWLQLGRLFWQRSWAAACLAAVLIGTSAPYVITHVEMRYRTPMLWAYALLGSHLLVSLSRGRVRTESAPQSTVMEQRAAA